MKEKSLTIVESQRLPQTKGLLTQDKKALREPKTAAAPCGGSEKPPGRAGMGCNGLAKPLPGEKIAENRPTPQEHEPKWEIPTKSPLDSSSVGLPFLRR